MKAMILAAGHGKRLQPLTCTLPKPMLPLCGRPLLAWLVDSLLHAEIRDIVINLHHLPAAIERALPDLFPHARFHFLLEPEIRGTGGGVRNARARLESDADFILLNGDTFQRPRYADLLRARREHDSISALTLRHPPAGDFYTAVWQEGGWVNGFGHGRGEPLMFSGSHCVSSRIFSFIPDKDASDMTGEVYQPMVAGGRQAIAATVDDDPLWFDIGTPRRYLAACRALSKGPVAGARSVVEGDVRDSVIWDDCFIARGVMLESCIVAHGVELRAPMDLRNAIICRDDPAIPRDPAYRFENGLVIVSI